ncbi:TPA: hypothetical protein R6913_004178 [Klebsiella pneumoniae]|nr:hypothetical protein APT85_03970 [Klebsiella pneumoniae]HEE1923134.1 hypothetical protein [Klebsiella pneumoniae]
MGVALSNIQLQTIINNSVDNPDYLLLKNDIRIQRAKEKNKKEHARGFYFGDEHINSLKSPNIDPFHIYIISPENQSRRDDYSLVIFPFDIKKLIHIIDKIDGIALGHIQLSSNFNAFQIHKPSKSKRYCGVGYSMKVDNEDNLWNLIIELKKHLLLPAGTTGKLSSIYYQSGLPRHRNENNTNENILEYFSLIASDTIGHK